MPIAPFDADRSLRAGATQFPGRRKAAEAGFAPAQFNLGRLHAAGTGTPRDFALARKWLEQAERGGIADARRVLQWMEQKMDEK